MEEFKLGQLTKELVTAKLRAMDDPCEAAAELVLATLTVAFRGIPENSEKRLVAVEDACRGGIIGLLLSEQSVSRGAVALLERIAALASTSRMDPTAAMEASLRGIADVKRFLLPERVEELRAAVDAKFLGAGDVLRAYLDRPAPEVFPAV